MKTWGKIILFAIPFLVLIFFYIAHEQHKQRAVMHKQSVAFSRDWNEFNYKFTHSKVYKKRAQARQKELNNIKRKIHFEKKEAIKEFNNNFNKQMKRLG